MHQENLDTVVIGGGQAGLVTGYHLRRAKREFVILDAGSAVGEKWQSRWDSLHLFSPAHWDALSGLRFPGTRGHMPSKDETAEYLKSYAQRFDLPIRLNTRAESLTRVNGRFVVTSGDESFDANNVVIAIGPMGTPKIPSFADQLVSEILQLHSTGYRNPTQLRPGSALVVGAGNSGAEIALELAATHTTTLAGRDIGRMPVRPGSLPYRITNALFTADTKMGKKFAAHGGGGTPLVRVTNEQLAAAGVERAPKVVAAQDQYPQLEDGRVVKPDNIIWATGFEPQDYRWVKLSSFGSDQAPAHRRGIVESEPGLYFVGLAFQHSFASSLMGGVSADAKYVVKHIVARSTAPTVS